MTMARISSGKDIKDKSVTGADIDDRSLGKRQLSTAAVESLRTSWNSGVGAPTAKDGSTNSWYLDTATGDAYKNTPRGWELRVNIMGATGAPGAVGPQAGAEVGVRDHGGLGDGDMQLDGAEGTDDGGVARPSGHVAQQGGAVVAEGFGLGQAAAPAGAPAGSAGAQMGAEGAEAKLETVRTFRGNRHGQREEHRGADRDQAAVEP